MDKSIPRQLIVEEPSLHKGYGIWRRLQDREHNPTASFWKRDELFRYFYSTFSPEKSKCFHYGEHLTEGEDAVFNLKFSQEGILAAVLASGGVLLLDSRTARKVAHQASAHEDCVNVVCFMDNVRFFTGSDDCTIKLWDSRNLSSCVECFTGHRSWVKNLEYDSGLNFLYSSGFDDTVRVWDVCNASKPSSVLIRNSLLFRMCVSPQRNALVCSTRSNLLYSVQPIPSRRGSLERSRSREEVAPTGPPRQTADALLEYQDSSQRYLKQIDFEKDRKPLFLPPEYPSSHRKLHNAELRPGGGLTIGNMYSVCFSKTGQHLALRGTAMVGSQMQDVVLTYEYTDHNDGSTGNSRQSIVAQFVMPRQESGIIKEIAFDSSGRFIVTPCGSEVIIFDSFTESNSILGRCGGCGQNSEAGNVLSCQFSPIEPLVASGSMNGCIDFHYPRL